MKYLKFIALLLLAGGVFAQLGPLEKKMQDQGLVDIHSMAPDILVNLKYSSEDNFLHADTYGELETCYLQEEAANKLRIAQGLLQRSRPDLTLLVFDGARPRSVQRKMWALVVGTTEQEYVANPDRGSVHNYGCAVDLTIAYNDGTPLDMGTPFDFFGDLAQPKLEAKFLESGELTSTQIENRDLLRQVMTEAGFKGISNEWWHFNAVPVKVARSKYGIVE